MTLRNLLWILGICLLLTPNFCFGAETQPNIVLLFIDDMGWRDAGYAGSDFYETPNIDRLAEGGMVFTGCYAGAGNCAPSRACLLSGQYTPRHGLYAVGDTTRGPKDKMRLVAIPNAKGLASENVTFAEALKAAGYATGQFGKWHLDSKNDPDGTSPVGQGFDVGFAPNRDFAKTKDPKGIFQITAAACEFMEENKEGPFFAYIAHHAIHLGIQATPASLEKFEKQEPGELHQHAPFAAMIENMDQGVGLVIQKIEELGLSENTIVLFTSDNGGLPRSSQSPLRAFKGAYYEGGIREPMIIKWPGVVKPGSTCSEPVTSTDFYPTMLQMAGLPLKPKQHVDGVSLVPLLKGKGKLEREAIYWHYPHYHGSGNKPSGAIRAGDYKLIEWYEDNSVELYNLKDDIGEKNDLAATMPEKAAELRNMLHRWLKQMKATVPTPEQLRQNGMKVGKVTGKINGRRNKELKRGIFSEAYISSPKYLEDKRSERVRITQDMVLREYWRIANSDILQSQ